jgi:hypothetical protein
LRDVIVEARAVGPHTLTQLNHPRSFDRRADNLDAASYFTHLGVAGEPFRPDRPLHEGANRFLVEADSRSGVRDIDFDLIELMNGMSPVHYRRARADWLSLLLQGEVRTGTANSDSHDAATPVALPRNYVRAPDDRMSHLDRDAFLAALRGGHVVGTSGPWVEVSIGGAGPGDTWSGTDAMLQVAVRAASWVPVSELRVRVNGALVHREPSQSGAAHQIGLRFAADAFVTVEVEGEADEVYEAFAPGGQPLAFTNPIFIDADGDGCWQPPGLPAKGLAVLRDPDGTR